MRPSNQPPPPAAPPAAEEASEERALFPIFAASRRRARPARPAAPPTPTRAELAAPAERVFRVGAFAEELARVDVGEFAIRSPLLVARDVSNLAAALGLRRSSMASVWRALTKQVSGGGALPDSGDAASYYAAVVRASALASARGPGGAPAVMHLVDAKKEFELFKFEADALPTHAHRVVLVAAQEAAWRRHGSRDAILRRRAAVERAREAAANEVAVRREALTAGLAAARVYVPQALRCPDLVSYINNGAHAAAGLPALVARGRRFAHLDDALDDARFVGALSRFGGHARTVPAFMSHVRRGVPSHREAAAAVERAGMVLEYVFSQSGGQLTILTERPGGIFIYDVLREDYFAMFLAGRSATGAWELAGRFVRRCRLRRRLRDECLRRDREADAACRSFVKDGGDLNALVAAMHAAGVAAAAVAAAVAAEEA